MALNMFRLLRADEIDARIGSVKDAKDGKAGGVTLLLYKDARCDMTILDETVGPFNWKREHSRDNANCIVSIWDKEKQQWVSKEDVGTASKTEAEKGLASDSFKRACTNWGIGRELYTSPFIFIPGKPDVLKFEKFTVTEIAYTETTREISKLIIKDRSGRVVYDMKNPPSTAIFEPPITPQTVVKSGDAPEKPQNKQEGASTVQAKAEVTTTQKVPEMAQNVTVLKAWLEKFTADYKDDEKHTRLYQMLNVLRTQKKISDKKLSALSVPEVNSLFERIYAAFPAEEIA